MALEHQGLIFVNNCLSQTVQVPAAKHAHNVLPQLVVPAEVDVRHIARALRDEWRDKRYARLMPSNCLRTLES